MTRCRYWTILAMILKCRIYLGSLTMEIHKSKNDILLYRLILFNDSVGC